LRRDHELIEKTKKTYPKVSIKSSEEFFSWFNSIAPTFILHNIVECKSLKACGFLSSKFSIKALSSGFPCFTLYGPGHITNIVITSDGIFEIDFSHLQFVFPMYGSLREIPMEEKEEYKKMKDLFDELEKDPMKAVKIEKIENIDPEYLQIEKSIFAKSILDLFKQASFLISQ